MALIPTALHVLPVDTLKNPINAIYGVIMTIVMFLIIRIYWLRTKMNRGYICSMKKGIMLLLLLVIALALAGQTITTNIVKNPDFEARSRCAFNNDEITRALNWDPGNVDPLYIWPEYYNSCSNGSSVGIPFQQYGKRKPDSTVYSWSSPNPYNGYAGIITHSEFGNNSRTHLSGDFLNKPWFLIQANKVYYWSMRVRREYKCNYATSIGIQLSNQDVSLAMNPALTNDTFAIHWPNAIVDTGWVTIAGEFTANDNYDGFSIGNFYTDTTNRPEEINSNGIQYAYYYIDNVCISSSPNVCDSQITAGIGPKESGSKVAIYPNPCTQEGGFNVSGIENLQLSIYNSIGQRVDRENLVPGTYTVQITKGDLRVLKRLIVTP